MSALIRMVCCVGIPLIESCLTHAVIKLKARQLRIKLLTPGLVGNQGCVVSSCWVTLVGVLLQLAHTRVNIRVCCFKHEFTKVAFLMS